MFREEWKRLVIEWLASGERCTEFCSARGLKPKQLSWWKWRLTNDGENLERPLPVPFIELTFPRPREASGASERIELEVGHIQVRIPDDFLADTLARVLDVLEAR